MPRPSIPRAVPPATPAGVISARPGLRGHDGRWPRRILGLMLLLACIPATCMAVVDRLFPTEGSFANLAAMRERGWHVPTFVPPVATEIRVWSHPPARTWAMRFRFPTGNPWISSHGVEVPTAEVPYRLPTEQVPPWWPPELDGARAVGAQPGVTYVRFHRSRNSSFFCAVTAESVAHCWHRRH
ncbi:MAG: hypothetical protein AB2A00_00860 [Myxococcota bacterium]